MYEQPSSPAQSATSLSDNEDEYLNKSSFFPTEPVAVGPARWTTRRIHAYSPGAVQPTASPIAKLPTEILIHVLRHLHFTRDLYNCMLVSRSWCECSVELLWHKPNFTSTSTLVKMMRVIGSEDPAFTYSRFIRRLNFLYLGPELTDALFSRVAQCVRLERLTLVNCKSISDEMLARVLPWFPNLVAIDLTGVSETNDKAITALASSSKRLQGINLGGCKRVTDKGIQALAGNCALLRRVKLSGVERITDAAVTALAISCPLLLEIDLNNCKRVSDQSIRNVWTQSYHMREMRLSHVEELTGNGFPASPRILATAVAPNAQAPNPFPSSSAKILDEVPPLIMTRRFEHLRMLDLTSCSQLTDDAVDGIICSAPKIRNLVLARCSQLTDSAVESIAKLGKHLHYLHLGHCSNITDSSVKNLARSCTRLRYIDFANCTLLTDMSVFELSALPKLRRIGLVRISNLTDEAIYSLADRHATLERIHLSYCNRITVMSIHFLLQKLPKLTHLSLTGIPAFRRAELQKFCRSPPAEFNSSQRAAFCVYSGKGVSDLRDFLIELFNNITDELQGTDDTDYDDQEEYDEDYPPADTEGDFEGDEDDAMDITPDMAFPPRGARPSVPAAQYAQATRGHAMTRAQRHLPATRTQAPVHMPIGMPEPGIIPTAGPSPYHMDAALADVRAIPAMSALLPSAGVFRRPNHRGFGTQPIVEPGSPPPRTPSDVASTRSTNSNGATFFRTYQDHGLPSPSARNGVITPDLVFAEIGHGRGTGHPPSFAASRGYTMGMAAIDGLAAGSSQVPPPLASPTDAVYGAAMSSNPLYRSQGHEQSVRDDDASNSRSDWAHVHREAASPTSSASARELHESVQAALSGVNRTSGDRGRHVARGLRNATHFLFGRGPSAGAPPGEGTGTHDR